MDDSFDEILSLVSQAKRDLLNQIGLEKAAQKETVVAARHQLSAAIGAAKNKQYREALRQFRQLQSLLETADLLESEWAELYVAQAICFARLGEKKDMAQVWKRAQILEPDNEVLKEIAVKLGLV